VGVEVYLNDTSPIKFLQTLPDSFTYEVVADLHRYVHAQLSPTQLVFPNKLTPNQSPFPRRFFHFKEISPIFARQGDEYLLGKW